MFLSRKTLDVRKHKNDKSVFFRTYVFSSQRAPEASMDEWITQAVSVAGWLHIAGPNLPHLGGQQCGGGGGAARQLLCLDISPPPPLAVK